MEDSPCKRDRMLEDRRDVACIREKKSSLILVALAVNLKTENISVSLVPLRGKDVLSSRS